MHVDEDTVYSRPPGDCGPRTMPLDPVEVLPLGWKLSVTLDWVLGSAAGETLPVVHVGSCLRFRPIQSYKSWVPFQCLSNITVWLITLNAVLVHLRATAVSKQRLRNWNDSVCEWKMPACKSGPEHSRPWNLRIQAPPHTLFLNLRISLRIFCLKTDPHSSRDGLPRHTIPGTFEPANAGVRKWQKAMRTAITSQPGWLRGNLVRWTPY